MQWKDIGRPFSRVAANLPKRSNFSRRMPREETILASSSSLRNCCPRCAATWITSRRCEVVAAPRSRIEQTTRRGQHSWSVADEQGLLDRVRGAPTQNGLYGSRYLATHLICDDLRPKLYRPGDAVDGVMVGFASPFNLVVLLALLPQFLDAQPVGAAAYGLAPTLLHPEARQGRSAARDKGERAIVVRPAGDERVRMYPCVRSLELIDARRDV